MADFGVTDLGPICEHGRYKSRCVACGAEPLNASTVADVVPWIVLGRWADGYAVADARRALDPNDPNKGTEYLTIALVRHDDGKTGFDVQAGRAGFCHTSIQVEIPRAQIRELLVSLVAQIDEAG